MKIIKNARYYNISPIYKCWQHMRSRCLNVNDPKYPRYGGRGITICERWASFENFYADMGDKPKDKTLGRINNDGNYEPTNCRWETATEQANNRRRRSRNENEIQGVYWKPRRQKWQAFGERGETLYWGPDFFEACCARKSWENKKYGPPV